MDGENAIAFRVGLWAWQLPAGVGDGGGNGRGDGGGDDNVDAGGGGSHDLATKV